MVLAGPSAAQEAQLLHGLIHQREWQYAQVAAESQDLVAKAAATEEELVFAQDHASFCDNQLAELVRRDGLGHRGFEVRQRATEQKKLAASALSSVEHRLAGEDELSEARARSAWVGTRIHAMRGLCGFADAEDGSFVAKLEQCEGALLEACAIDTAGTDAGVTTQHMLTSFQAATPLATMLPLLIAATADSDAGKAQWSDSAKAARDKWLQQGFGGITNSIAEEVRLRREVEDLADRNDTLRREEREEARSREALEAEVERGAAAEAEAQREAEAWQQNSRNEQERAAVLQGNVAQLREEQPALEQKVRAVLRQLGSEQAAAAAQREELQRSRAAARRLEARRRQRLEDGAEGADAERLGELEAAEAADRAHQIRYLRQELADAYTELARHTKPLATIADGASSSTRRRLGSDGSNSATDAGGSRPSEADQDYRAPAGTVVNQAEIWTVLAKNTKEINALKEELREGEAQEEREAYRSSRQESKAAPAMDSIAAAQHARAEAQQAISAAQQAAAASRASQQLHVQAQAATAVQAKAGLRGAAPRISSATASRLQAGQPAAAPAPQVAAATTSSTTGLRATPTVSSPQLRPRSLTAKPAGEIAASGSRVLRR